MAKRSRIWVEDSGVRCRVGAWGATDGRLVDLDDFVELVCAVDGFVRARFFARAVKFLGERAIENVVDEGGFSGTAYTGDDGHDAEWEVGGDVLEIVGGGILHGRAICR